MINNTLRIAAKPVALSSQFLRPLPSVSACPHASTTTSAIATSSRRTLTARYFSSDDGADPLGTINSATASIQAFTSRLSDLSETIGRDVKLSSGQSVTLRDIVLHSRDATVTDFASPAAVSARAEVQSLAAEVEDEMKSMAQDFMADVAPLMSRAASICQETPCGGATWVMAEEGRFSTGQSVEEEFSGKDTPCGRLEVASQEFVELTHQTREEVALGSRAALLLRMAKEHNAPLVEVRKTREGKEAMAERFGAEMIPTPWIRPKEEYEQMKRMKEQD